MPMVDGPATGLEILASLEGPITNHYRVDAVRAHLLEMDGNPSEAARLYARAASRTTNLPEQRYLTAKAVGLRDLADPG